MNMKAYMKPIIKMVDMEEEVMVSNSVTLTTGLEDVTISTEDFGGGAADARQSNSLWDEESIDRWKPRVNSNHPSS